MTNNVYKILQIWVHNKSRNVLFSEQNWKIYLTVKMQKNNNIILQLLFQHDNRKIRTHKQYKMNAQQRLEFRKSALWLQTHPTNTSNSERLSLTILFTCCKWTFTIGNKWQTKRDKGETRKRCGENRETIMRAKAKRTIGENGNVLFATMSRFCAWVSSR